jgi:hypothetical protein
MEMHPILQQILQRYGTSVIEEPGRFAALLNDLRMGEGKREANLLLLALHHTMTKRPHTRPGPPTSAATVGSVGDRG